MTREPKSHAPTARRLRQARQNGDVPLSRWTLAFGAWASASTLFLYGADTGWALLQTVLRDAVSFEETQVGWQILAPTIWALAGPLCGAAAFTALGFGVIQTGGHFRLHLRPKPPRAAFSPWLSTSLALLLVGAGLAWQGSSLHASGQSLAAATGSWQRLISWLEEQGNSLLQTALAVGLAGSAVEISLTQILWRRRLRMSRGDLAQESKETEGDPALKQLRESLREQLLRETDLSRLAHARLLVIGTGWQTTVLQYDPLTDTAPLVLLQGAGALGALLQTEASKRGLRQLKEPLLAQTLSGLAPGSSIPDVAYAQIAEAMAPR